MVQSKQSMIGIASQMHRKKEYEFMTSRPTFTRLSEVKVMPMPEPPMPEPENKKKFLPSQDELKYSIAVDENAFFIRFYVWLWEADPAKVNFCKLLWAYVFAIPALVVRGFIGLMRRTYRWILRPIGKAIEFVITEPIIQTKALTSKTKESVKERREKEQEIAKLAKIKEEERILDMDVEDKVKYWHEQADKLEENKKDSLMQRGLEKIEHRGTITTMQAKNVKNETKEKVTIAINYFGNKIGKPIGRVVSSPVFGRVALGLAAAFGITCVTIAGIYMMPPMLSAIGTVAGASAYAVSHAAPAAVHAVAAAPKSHFVVLTFLGVLGVAIIISTIFMAFMVGIPMMIMKYIMEPAADRIEKVGSVSGRTIGTGLRGFLEAMRIGIYAVKTSTCPRIEIEKRPDHGKTTDIERELDIR